MTPASNLLAKLQEAANSPVKSEFNARVLLERSYPQKIATAKVRLPYVPVFDETLGTTTFAVPDCLGVDGTPSTLTAELEAELIAADKATVNQGFSVKKIVERSFTGQILTADISLPLEEAIDADGVTTFTAADSLTAAA